MRTALLAAVAVIIAATPAAAETGGYLGLEYANADFETLFGDDELEGWQSEGAFGWRGGGWGAQIDGSFGNLEESGGTDGDVSTIDGHLYWDGGNWIVGGVITHTNMDFGSGGSADETAYGVEALFAFTPRSNISASLTVGEADFIADADTWNLDAGVNFYATPNIRIGALLGTGNLDSGPNDFDTFTAGIDGEFQPWSAPVSLTAAWRHYETDAIDLEANAFQVGVRWNFGGGTLQDRDKVTPFTTYGPLRDRMNGIW